MATYFVFMSHVHVMCAMLYTLLMIHRAFAPHSDLLWMETAKPIIEEAREFAHGVKAAFPHQMLAYNLSPSFNWDGVSHIISDYFPIINTCRSPSNSLLAYNLSPSFNWDGVSHSTRESSLRY